MPAVSSAKIDYFCRPKAAAYVYRRLYSPVFISAIVDGAEIKFGICNDGAKDYSGVLTYRLYDSDNRVVSEGIAKANAAAGTSAPVITEDYSKIIGTDLGNYYVAYELMGEKATDATGTRLFTSAKRFNFKNPHIKAKIGTGSGGYEITLEADSYARFVELSFTDIDAEFSDNYFDLRAAEAKKITFTTRESVTVAKLEKMLTVRSVYDIGRVKSQGAKK